MSPIQQQRSQSRRSEPGPVHIDRFAGSVTNRERGTGRRIAGSPELALSEDSPGFTHFVFQELGARARALDGEIQIRFPDSKYLVVPGDTNTTIDIGLGWLRGQGTSTGGPHLGPVLAYVDPNKHTELSWQLVEKLASFTRTPRSSSDRPRARPIESLILFPTNTMRRCLPTADGNRMATGNDMAVVDRMYGSGSWRMIYQDKRSGIITGDDGWRLYVDLYRSQLEGLRYRHVQAVETRNTENGMLYHMVSASDSDAGGKIMNAVLRRASKLFPRRIQEAKELASGRSDDALFDPDEEEIAYAPDRYAALFVDSPVLHTPGKAEHVPVTTPTPVKRRAREPVEEDQVGFTDL